MVNNILIPFQKIKGLEELFVEVKNKAECLFDDLANVKLELLLERNSEIGWKVYGENYQNLYLIYAVNGKLVGYTYDGFVFHRGNNSLLEISKRSPIKNYSEINRNTISLFIKTNSM